MASAATGAGVPKRLESVHNVRRKALAVAAILGTSSALAASTDIAYSISLRETFTDNVSAGGSGSSDGAESDLITEVTPGLSISHRGGRVSGDLSVDLRSHTYLNDSSRNTSNISGSGRASAELVDRLLVLDLGGTVRRQDSSAFGRSSIDQALDTGNRSVVRQFYLNPKASFQFGPEMEGTASFRRDWTSGAALSGSRRQQSLSLNLTNPLAFGPLGWNLGYVYRQTESDANRGAGDQQTLRATAQYRYSGQLTLRLIGGRETNDYENGVDRDNTIRGAGVDWVLSPLTRASATIEKRFFGTGFNYSLTHSRPLSSLQLSYVRDVSSIENSVLLSLEEISFRDFFASLASSIPDPVARERAARELAGAVPNGQSTFSNFVTDSFSVTRSLQLSASLIGARNVLSFVISSGDSERIGSGDDLDPEDDFSRFSRVNTRNISLSLSHRLSGLSTLSAAITENRTEGGGSTSAEVTRRSMTFGYNTRIGSRTNGAITLRRQRSSGSNEFTENALVGSINTRF